MRRAILLFATLATAFGGLTISLRAKPVASKQADVHWSLRPLVRPKPPVQNEPTAWGRTPIDSFITNKLLEKKLVPNPQADRRTLIRRVTFDLTGLPPTPDEVKAFESDVSSDAYEKRVDRLLASPAYGERWARHWLDVVHYGESHGFGMDRPRPNAWPYRDYVIKSLNDDKPYARFIEEQLAGDVLYPDEPQATVALGFIACGPWNQSALAEQIENTACKRQAQNLDRDDMLTSTMSTFVSTTVHCARCHDHKFDPVSQREYYALQSVFAAVDKADRPYDPDPKLHAKRLKLTAQKLALETGIVPAGLEMPPVPTAAELTTWEQSLAQQEPARWQVTAPAASFSDAGSTATPMPDGSVLFGGVRPERDTYTVYLYTELRNITAIRMEALPDPSLPKGGPGRADNGNFALSEFRVVATDAHDDKPVHDILPIAKAVADFEEKDWPAHAAFDVDDKTAWGVHPQIGHKHTIVFQFKEPIAGFDGGMMLRLRIQQWNPGGHLIGRPRFSLSTQPKVGDVRLVPGEIAAALEVPPQARTSQQWQRIGQVVRRWRIDGQLMELPAPSYVYAGTSNFVSYHNFKPAKSPRPIGVLKRGEIDNVISPASPGALACVADIPANFSLPNPDDEGARRAALAKWLSDERNVLTWRSIVNRVWHYHFGRGICDTPSDFGRMGGRPTHPELLDWLAVWFRDDAKGSLKALHRLIVTSAVYRQTSTHNDAYARVDAGNQYLWRMNRTRLDAECVRDAILQITGRIDRKMGGPSVKQMNFLDPNVDLTPKADYGNFDVDSPESRRRSIYRFILRTVPDPFMESMDSPDASQLTAKRNVSVTPLQSLAMLNNRFVVRYAEHLAARVWSSGELPAQIARAYELAFNRAPTGEESAALVEYAKTFGMSNACRVILNSNEFLFVD